MHSSLSFFLLYGRNDLHIRLSFWGLSFLFRLPLFVLRSAGYVGVLPKRAEAEGAGFLSIRSKRRKFTWSLSVSYSGNKKEEEASSSSSSAYFLAPRVVWSDCVRAREENDVVLSFVCARERDGDEIEGGAAISLTITSIMDVILRENQLLFSSHVGNRDGYWRCAFGSISVPLYLINTFCSLFHVDHHCLKSGIYTVLSHFLEAQS